MSIRDKKTKFLADELATLDLGAKLAAILRKNWLESRFVLFLEGDLGSGKTTFVRGFLKGLGYQDSVKSPTYTLVETYEFKLPPQHVYHFDLYRISQAEELEYIGIREYFNEAAVLLIEWADHGEKHLPPPDLLVKLMLKEPGRTFEIEGFSNWGKHIAEQLEHFHL